jgi:predicted amidohydrolase YtcJ
LGRERAAWAYPFRTLKECGVTLAASTDCPVEWPDAAAVYGNFIHRADGREEEALTPAEALHAFTFGADQSLGLEGPGGFQEGAAADFLILQPDARWPLPPTSPFPIERVVMDGETVA